MCLQWNDSTKSRNELNRKIILLHHVYNSNSQGHSYYYMNTCNLLSKSRSGVRVYWLPQLDNDPAIYRMAWRLTMVKNQTNKKKLHTGLKNYFVLIHFHFFLFLQVEWKWKKNKIKTCSKIFIRWSTMHGGVSYLLEKSSNGCDGGTCPL